MLDLCAKLPLSLAEVLLRSTSTLERKVLWNGKRSLPTWLIQCHHQNSKQGMVKISTNDGFLVTEYFQLASFF